MNAEIEYLNLLRDILENGTPRNDRTGVGCLSVFGRSIRHDYSLGFPILTTKKVFVKGVIHELLWFLKGTEDAQYLIDNNVHIWDAWMQEDGGKKVLPHTYGTKWRNFYGVDQVANLINQIKENPDSRRLFVSAWDAANINNAALPWCHVSWQIDVVREENKPAKDRIDDGKKGDMSIMVSQRSGDSLLGCPYNLASYSFLLHMIAEVTGYRPKQMYYSFGNCHIYNNHIEQCRLQITRQPYELPTLKLKHRDNIDDFVIDDFEIQNYKFHPAIKGAVAV